MPWRGIGTRSGLGKMGKRSKGKNRIKVMLVKAGNRGMKVSQEVTRVE